MGDVAGVGVDASDRVYLFHRGEHPLIVLDRDGNYLRSWGDGVFNRAHGVHMGPDESIYLTDEGDHTVRKCSLDGRVLLTIGIPGTPAPFMSGEPFRRCTHTALSPDNEIYVSDGYGNARVHKYSQDGTRMMSWGEPGAGPGQFNLPHNISCDADGWVYVADRENHRIQVFDGNGRFETQWHDMHRPSGMYMPPGKCPICYVGEIGPYYEFNGRAQSRPAIEHSFESGQAARAHFDRTRRRDRARTVHFTAWYRGGFARRHLCGRSLVHGVAESLSGSSFAACAAQSAEVREGVLVESGTDPG